MTRSFRTLAAAGAMALALTSPAWGQSSLCGPRSVMLDMIEKRFGEKPSAAGIIELVNDSVLVVELLLSPEGSFTILQTTPDGVSCVMTGGKEWTPAHAQKGKGV